MAKVIAPNELAEIVTGLLINPALLGELDSVEQHQAFMEEIAQVVANHCGGTISGISAPTCADKSYLTGPDDSPYTLIRPDDSLPSLTQNVWAGFDTDGWEDEIAEAMDEGADIPQPLTQDAINSLRAELQQLLPLTAKRFDTDY